jgi:hypothetical protein
MKFISKDKAPEPKKCSVCSGLYHPIKEQCPYCNKQQLKVSTNINIRIYRDNNDEQDTYKRYSLQ